MFHAREQLVAVAFCVGATLDSEELWARRMRNNGKQSCVIAFAGRRTDEENAEPSRFPFERVPAVREALTALFLRERAVSIDLTRSTGARSLIA